MSAHAKLKPAEERLTRGDYPGRIQALLALAEMHERHCSACAYGGGLFDDEGNPGDRGGVCRHGADILEEHRDVERAWLEERRRQ